MNISFALAIPTINRWDLLKPTLEKYLTMFPLTDIVVLDNGKQNIKFDLSSILLTVIELPEPKGVAGSWNFLSRIVFRKHSHCLMLNDDVFLNRSFLDIMNLLSYHPDHDLYAPMAENGLPAFILPKTTFNKIGAFDEAFKGAYFEDTDYERRLKLAKMDVLRHISLNPVIYETSGSIKKDPSLNRNFENNRDHYEAKWGGCKGGETYLTPFNH